MDLQTLATAFENAVLTQFNTNQEDLKNVDPVSHLHGKCEGLKNALLIFGDVVRSLLPQPTDANPPVDASADTSTSDQSNSADSQPVTTN